MLYKQGSEKQITSTQVKRKRKLCLLLVCFTLRRAVASDAQINFQNISIKCPKCRKRFLQINKDRIWEIWFSGKWPQTDIEGSKVRSSLHTYTSNTYPKGARFQELGLQLVVHKHFFYFERSWNWSVKSNGAITDLPMYDSIFVLKSNIYGLRYLLHKIWKTISPTPSLGPMSIDGRGVACQSFIKK